MKGIISKLETFENYKKKFKYFWETKNLRSLLSLKDQIDICELQRNMFMYVISYYRNQA